MLASAKYVMLLRTDARMFGRISAFLLMLVTTATVYAGLSPLAPHAGLPALAPIIPRLFVLSIGIDHYSNTPMLNLDYSVSDAIRVSRAFSGLGQRAILAENIVITDDNATRSNILSTAEGLASRLSDSDLLIIYWAGQSSQDLKSKDMYLLDYDTRLSDSPNGPLSSTAISIKQDIARLAAGHLHILFLGDGCHIGDGLLGDTALAEPTFGIISSSKRDEVSGEGTDWNGSPFAQELAASLNQNIPDLDGDGLISVEELYLYLYPRLVQATHRKVQQHPGLFGSMTHRMYLSQAPESFQTFVMAGSVPSGLGSSGTVKINGIDVAASVDSANGTISLGNTNQSIFRQGLNLIEMSQQKFFYWREQDRLSAFQIPYKMSYAVLVAIDDYDRMKDPHHRGRTGYHELSGMVDRSKELRDALVNVGFPNENIISLYDEKATSNNIEEILRKFWKGGVYDKADRVFIYFGGHGEVMEQGCAL
jgi:hypothetical protein